MRRPEPALMILMFALGGCSGGSGGASGGIDAHATTLGGGFRLPLDAVSDSTGMRFYFTALDATGAPAVFSVAAAGGTPQAIASGPPLVSPFALAISSDDGTLVVGDVAFADATNERGAVFSLPSAGGTPSALAGAAGLLPRALHVASENGADQIYFTGTNPADDSGAVYKMPLAGGAAQTIATGLGDLGGIVVSRTGRVYVVDTRDGTDNMGAVLDVTGGAQTVLAGGLRVGYPAGLTITTDETKLIVSGLDAATGTSLVYVIDVKAQKLAGTFNQGIGANSDSGGLHRAQKADVFAWSGPTAQGGAGAVYRVTLK